MCLPSLPWGPVGPNLQADRSGRDLSACCTQTNVLYSGRARARAQARTHTHTGSPPPRDTHKGLQGASSSHRGGPRPHRVSGPRAEERAAGSDRVARCLRAWPESGGLAGQTAGPCRPGPCLGRGTDDKFDRPPVRVTRHADESCRNIVRISFVVGLAAQFKLQRDASPRLTAGPNVTRHPDKKQRSNPKLVCPLLTRHRMLTAIYVTLYWLSRRLNSVNGQLQWPTLNVAIE